MLNFCIYILLACDPCRTVVLMDRLDRRTGLVTYIEPAVFRIKNVKYANKTNI